MYYIIEIQMKKLLKLYLIVLILSSSAFAASDGENKLSKKILKPKLKLKTVLSL